MALNVIFSEDLKYNSGKIWDKILNHKFVIEISNDTLPIGKFIFYLKQDRLFLRTFCNLLDGSSTITLDKEEKKLIEGLLRGVNDEMRMQNEILYDLKYDNIDTVGISMHSITLEYTSYLKSMFHSKEIKLIVSALAPCPWTYYEIASSLSSSDMSIPVYKKWLEFYSSRESLALVNQIKLLLDRMAFSADEKKRVEMRGSFALSCNYELQFWNMAYFHQ